MNIPQLVQKGKCYFVKSAQAVAFEAREFPLSPCKARLPEVLDQEEGKTFGGAISPVRTPLVPLTINQIRSEAGSPSIGQSKSSLLGLPIGLPTEVTLGVLEAAAVIESAYLEWLPAPSSASQSEGGSVSWTWPHFVDASSNTTAIQQQVQFLLSSSKGADIPLTFWSPLRFQRNPHSLLTFPSLSLQCPF